VDDAIAAALASGHYIDITTTGRRSGLPRRLEIAIHRFDGRWYISGSPSPRKRSWIANLEADPRMTVHLKGPGPIADLPATARIIDAEPEVREVMPRIAAAWRRRDVEQMIAASPLIEVIFTEPAAA
jgi:deazaflavin-dependent oxidoreductase (nitroreductase family)